MTTNTSKGPGPLALGSMTDREFALVSFAAARTTARNFLDRARNAATPEVQRMLASFARDEGARARGYYAMLSAA